MCVPITRTSIWQEGCCSRPHWRPLKKKNPALPVGFPPISIHIQWPLFVKQTLHPNLIKSQHFHFSHGMKAAEDIFFLILLNYLGYLRLKNHIINQYIQYAVGDFLYHWNKLLFQLQERRMSRRVNSLLSCLHLSSLPESCIKSHVCGLWCKWLSPSFGFTLSLPSFLKRQLGDRLCI